MTRFRLGAFLLVFGFACPLLIPLVVRANLSTEVKAAISVLLAIGVPELFMAIAAAILGREGFIRLKKNAFGIARRFVPPERRSIALSDRGNHVRSPVGVRVAGSLCAGIRPRLSPDP